MAPHGHGYGLWYGCPGCGYPLVAAWPPYPPPAPPYPAGGIPYYPAPAFWPPPPPTAPWPIPRWPW
ncbi:MAG TPA: hypothetical protein VIN09_08210 [Chloroflexota bacterium]